MMNFSPSPTSSLAAAAIVVILIFILIRNGKRSIWGFKDVVKDPRYWAEVELERKRVEEEAKQAMNWDDTKVASLTKQYILEAKSSRDSWEDARILEELGPRTHPTILDLLRNPSLYNQLVKPTGINLLPEAPFNRACDLLGDSPDSTTVDAFTPFLDDPSEEIRKDAAMAIAKTGSDTICPFVRRALRDQNQYVRSFALMGLEYALNRSGLPESVQVELFADILDLLRKNQNADNAAQILYRFDSEKARHYFLSQEMFTPQSPILHEVLKVLAGEKSAVPHDMLASLIATLAAQEMKYPKTYALGEALRLLGQHRHEGDRDFLRKHMTHPEEEVAEGAASGLLSSFGVEEFRQKIWDKEEHSGYESLSRPQQFYSAVFMCDAEINNGGFAQYFVNSSGDLWPDALAGLKAMGFKERAEIFTHAIAKFGRTEPSTNQALRQEQLSKLFKRNDSVFEKLEERFYQSSEVIEVFATHYVLENPESFR